MLFFKDREKVLKALENQVVQLINVMPRYIKEYSSSLLEAKDSKAQAALNRVSKNWEEIEIC